MDGSCVCECLFKSRNIDELAQKHTLQVDNILDRLMRGYTENDVDSRTWKTIEMDINRKSIKAAQIRAFSVWS